MATEPLSGAKTTQATRARGWLAVWNASWRGLRAVSILWLPLSALTALGVYHPVILSYIQAAGDRFTFNDDARADLPAPSVGASNYVARCYQSAFGPLAYTASYRLAAKFVSAGRDENGVGSWPLGGDSSGGGMVRRKELLSHPIASTLPPRDNIDGTFVRIVRSSC